jgi:hypothetical protein
MFKAFNAKAGAAHKQNPMLIKKRDATKVVR